jgi:hypothetical protein
MQMGLFATDKSRLCSELLSETAEVYYVVWTVVKFTLLAQPMRQALQVSTNQTHVKQIKANGTN